MLFHFQEFPSEERLRQAAREYPEMDPSASSAFIRMMHTASTGFHMIDTYMSRFGLSHGRFLVMMLLGKLYPDGLSPSDIAHKIGVTRATVTSLVEKLERDGLVRREHRTDDRRAVTVRVTDAGSNLIDDMLPGHLRRVKQAMADLSEEERNQLVTLLQKIRDGIASLPPLPPHQSESGEAVAK